VGIVVDEESLNRNCKGLHQLALMFAEELPCASFSILPTQGHILGE
jgi:hypothetical protein